MKRLLVGLALGVVLGSTAQGDEQVNGLIEVAMETAGRASFKLPEAYGRLVDVVVTSEVHYLYFEDGAGMIRVVLIGPRGAVPRARTSLQLLSPEVYLIRRGRIPPAQQEPRDEGR